MEQTTGLLQNVVASTKKLMAIEPDDSDVQSIVAAIATDSEQIATVVNAPAPPAFDLVSEQIEKLHAAAVIPAQNYRRIATITHNLKGLVKLASLPQNAGVRDQIRDIVGKVAGIFAEVDTVDDLDKPLETIEKAVEKLYGDQNAPKTYNFEQSGKGHHSKS